MKSATATVASPVDGRTPGDVWLLWPAITTIAAVALITFLCGVPGLVSFVLIPLSVLGYPLAAIAFVVAAGVLAAKRRFRKATSVALALLAPVLLWEPLNWSMECLHLGLTVGFGAGQIGSKSSSDGDQFAVYDWSTGLAGGLNTFLIRDATDEITLPLAQHRNLASSENGFEDECAGKVRHLIGHYYICTF